MSQPGQDVPDVPDELLQLVAELFSSWYGQDLDFTDEARTLLAAVLPAHEAMVRAKVSEAIAARRCDQTAAFCGSCVCRRENAAIARGTS